MRMSLIRWSHYRQTRRQTRTALHLLTLSGVVRPSTSELRYVMTPVKKTAIHERPEGPLPVQPHIPSQPQQTNPVMTRLQMTTRAWLEQSTHHLQQLQWGMGKTAWRIIGIPSVR